MYVCMYPPHGTHGVKGGTAFNHPLIGASEMDFAHSNIRYKTNLLIVISYLTLNF